MAVRQIKHKAVPFGLIQYDGDGIIEGFPAVFGNVDADGDVIVPGAFARTIKGGGRKAILGLDHQVPLGTTIELAEVGRNDLPREVLDAAPDATGGLWARGQVMLTPENIAHLDVIGRMTEGGNPPGMSFTYATIAERKAKGRYGREVNELVELALHEWGPDIRLKPRNAAARVTRAKAGDVAEGGADVDGIDEAAAKAIAGSYEDLRDAVADAIRVSGRFAGPSGQGGFYVDATYADRVVVCAYAPGQAEAHFAVPFGFVDGAVVLGEPVEVDLTTVVTAKAAERAADLEAEAALLAYINRAAVRLADARPAEAKAGAVLARVNLDDLDSAIEALTRIRARAVRDTGDATGQGTDADGAPTAKATADPTADLDALEWDLSILSAEVALLATK